MAYQLSSLPHQLSSMVYQLNSMAPGLHCPNDSTSPAIPLAPLSGDATSEVRLRSLTSRSVGGCLTSKRERSNTILISLLCVLYIIITITLLFFIYCTSAPWHLSPLPHQLSSMVYQLSSKYLFSEFAWYHISIYILIAFRYILHHIQGISFFSDISYII